MREPLLHSGDTASPHAYAHCWFWIDKKSHYDLRIAVALSSITGTLAIRYVSLINTIEIWDRIPWICVRTFLCVMRVCMKRLAHESANSSSIDKTVIISVCISLLALFSIDIISPKSLAFWQRGGFYEYVLDISIARVHSYFKHYKHTSLQRLSMPMSC